VPRLPPNARAQQRAGVARHRGATGEFTVEQLMEASVQHAAPAAAPAVDAATATCTWCGKNPEQVKKLLSHGGAHICNGCVALCAEILRAELGDSWDR
jgi:hypothetical protein